ncbi:hypothetical protein D9613_004868 [Agrocybe pediades]|uniref:NADAR domain-containing protein n=1 Tax=Agrocybe pediades TaxID=84607 RepID=A0A8H4VQV0_9AGAR|nr:hypothetical protein D9613_004868 [Agrocybe pediades]
MGASLSKKNQNPQYPYGAPYAVPYPPPQQPYMPPYGGVGGFGHTMFPQPQLGQQGFIPPGRYGTGGQNLPPPLLNWLPQDKQKKKKKSRRTQSEKFVGGFSSEARTNGVRRGRSESHHRSQVDAPVIPTRVERASSRRREDSAPMRRMPTPFIPPRDEPDEESEDGFDPSRGMPVPEIPNLQRTASRHSEIRFPSPHIVDGNIDNVLAPMEPPNRAAFGPTGERPKMPLKNPLPPPPRDLYEMTPYKSLLSLPQTTALLTATYGNQNLTTGSSAHLGVQPSVKRKKSKGLFRAFSKKDKHKEQEPPKVTFIPVFVPSKDDGSSQTAQALQRSVSQLTRQPSMNPSAGQPYVAPQNTGRMTMPTPHVPQHAAPATAYQSATSSSGHDTPMPVIPPVPPMPTSPPPVMFNQDGQYNGFLNHSPHRIIYRNQTYPTALHLHEAMKFIDHRPEIAETIRRCLDVHSVYPISAQYQEHQRSDWYLKYIDFMDEVLLLKFSQHPDLRATILGTGTADIVYDDPRDEFWGSGATGQGQNQLGKALVRVREKLRNQAM